MSATTLLLDNAVEHTILRSKLTAERAPLTNNVLQRIVAGEIIEQPIIQIMSAKLDHSSGKGRLVLLAYDGQWTEHVSCSPALTQRLLPQIDQLKLSIVQMDNYANVDGKIELIEMTWLNLGSDVCFNTSLLQHRATLSEGFIAELLEGGKIIRHPIVKVLKTLRIKNKSENKVRTCLVITDGERTTLAYLSTQLEQSLHGALSKRSIVRLEIYKANFLRRRSITVCELTLLNQRTMADFVWNVMPALPTLTDNFITRLAKGEHLVKPVVKIVSVNFVRNEITLKNQIRLLIYDGIKTCYAILPVYMNYLLDVMEQLPTVRLDSYNEGFRGHNRYAHILVVYEMSGLSLHKHTDVSNQYEMRLMRAALTNEDI